MWRGRSLGSVSDAAKVFSENTENTWPAGDLIAEWLVTSNIGRSQVAIAAEYVCEHEAEVQLAQLVSAAKGEGDSVLKHRIFGDYPEDSSEDRPQVQYFLEDILKPFEQKCQDFFLAASGLPKTGKSRAAKANRGYLESIQQTRKAVWQNAHDKMLNACGEAMYHFFFEAAVGMELQGVVKPELDITGDGTPTPVSTPVLPRPPACDVQTLPQPTEQPEQLTAPVATPESSASGLKSLKPFNLKMLGLLIQSNSQGASLKLVAEVVGSQHAIKEIALCADLLKEWESLGIKLNMFLRIGLCARSRVLADIWGQTLTSLAPEDVDAVTPVALQKFLAFQPEAKKKYILQKFRAFSAAKEEWRQARVRADCVPVIKTVMGLFASGASSAIPGMQLEAATARLGALIGQPGSNSSDNKCVDFVSLLVNCIKALSTCPAASGQQKVRFRDGQTCVLALNYCRAVIQSWPQAGLLEECDLFEAVGIGPAMHDVMTATVAKLETVVKDSSFFVSSF